jgi:hypothetical protein
VGYEQTCATYVQCDVSHPIISNQQPKKMSMIRGDWMSYCDGLMWTSDSLTNDLMIWRKNISYNA